MRTGDGLCGIVNGLATRQVVAGVVDADNERVFVLDDVAFGTFAQALHGVVHQWSFHTCSTAFFLGEENARAWNRPIDTAGGGAVG